jgi:hypothetical protein
VYDLRTYKGTNSSMNLYIFILYLMSTHILATLPKSLQFVAILCEPRSWTRALWIHQRAVDLNLKN